MSEVMYDGINSDAAIIARTFPNTPYVAGYISGRYAWSQADWDLFPKANKIRIATNASVTDGDVLDVEQGDALPSQCEAWITKRKAAGLHRPTIYCSLSAVPAVRQGTGKWILGKDYDLWVALYDGSLSNPVSGAVAKQYASGQNWDSNIVYDTNWPYRTEASPLPGAASGFSQTAYADHTNFGWHAAPDATEYDFQLVEGKTQVAREMISGLNVQNVQTKPNTTYAWHVAPRNVHGSSGWSSLRGFITPGVGFPAPTGLRAEPNIISVSWDAVPVTNGMTPTGYAVEVRRDAKTVKTLNVKGTTAVIDGLEQSAVYDVIVTADGGQGTAESAKISVTA